MNTKNKNPSLLKSIFLFASLFFIFIILMLSYTTVLAFKSGSDGNNDVVNLDNVESGEILDFNNLSSLSAKYESSGNAGTIADNQGDPGGKSYGAFQLASKRGSVSSFLIWLYNVDKKLYDRLSIARNADGGYGLNFDSNWTQIANEDQKYFYTLQYNYIKQSYFDVVINNFKAKNIDFTKRTKTLQNVIWSTVVQHGTGGAINLIGKLDLNLKENLADDSNLIKQIYNERRKVDIYFESSSQGIKNAVYNRFISEEKDALAMLKQELGGG